MYTEIIHLFFLFFFLKKYLGNALSGTDKIKNSAFAGLGVQLSGRAPA